MTHNPYANSNPEGLKDLWEACHNGMEERWDPALAGGMTWEEFDEQSKTMSISAYLHYETRQTPMFSEREDRIIADAFGDDFVRELRDIHEGRCDGYVKKQRQNRFSKFIIKLLSRD